MTPSAHRWFRRLAAATGVLVLGGCVVAQQQADQTETDLSFRLVAAGTHHHPHHHRHHRKHHRHHHRRHRGTHHHHKAGHHQKRHHHTAGHRHTHGRRMVHYTVRPGDTATGLAVRFHAWTAELLAINHLGPHDVIYVGQRLTIPVVRAAARRAAEHRHHKPHHRRHDKSHHGHHKPRHGHHKPRHRHHRSHHRHRHAHHGRHWADPSRARVRRAIIAAADRYGVAHNLALAIAWQESGWQMDQISSAHAIGAMQVMPATGRWLSSVVGRPLQLHDLHDNVTAGVLLLRVLRDHAGVRYTVAGYYQGLRSVRTQGMYHDTLHYVANVLYLRRQLRHGWNPT